MKKLTPTLISCPACGGNLSILAPSCPACGHPNEQRPSYRQRTPILRDPFFWLSIIIPFLIAVYMLW